MLIFEQVRVGGDRNLGYSLDDRDAGQLNADRPPFKKNHELK